MLSLSITKNKVSLINQKEMSGCILGPAKCALGNIISVLDEEFSDEPFLYTGDDIVNYLTDKFNGKRKNKIIKIWGMSVGSAEFHFIRNWFIDDFDNKEKITLTMKMIEVMRIKYKISTSYFPINRLNFSEGAEFKIQNIKEVIYALLYYYALNDLKLVKCEHCGRWFVTNSLKEKYCPRKSLLEEYTHLCCEQAVRNITQRIYDNKKKIYTAMTSYQTNEEVYNFLNEYAQYSDRIKKRHSIKNLSECLNFLKQSKNYNSVKVKLCNRINIQNISYQEREIRKEQLFDFENESQKWQEDVKNGYKTTEEYISWLKDYK